MCKVGVPLQFPGSLRWGYRGSAAFSGLNTGAAAAIHSMYVYTGSLADTEAIP